MKKKSTCYYIGDKTSAKDIYGEGLFPDLEDLFDCWTNSPKLSIKNTDYLPVYAEVLGKLRGTACTIIEVGVLDGGSLFMWRSWLGEKARIIGVDLNPQANQWKDHGFEIFIGDQSDPKFWAGVYRDVRDFDAVIDDGGHESFQQIVTVLMALHFASKKSVILIEDTQTSLMKSFSSHGEYSFLQYAKDASDILNARHKAERDGEFPGPVNKKALKIFQNVNSIQFYAGIVCFKVDPTLINRGYSIRNIASEAENKDFRHHGYRAAMVNWPLAFEEKEVCVAGKSQEDIIKMLSDKG